jgi:hypothetical protein
MIIRYGDNFDWYSEFKDDARRKLAISLWCAEEKKFSQDKADHRNRAVLAYWRHLPFGRDRCFGLIINDITVSYLAATFNKNGCIYLHLLYTPVAYRRHGYSSQPWLGVQSPRYSRVRATCQTEWGVAFFKSLNYTFKGIDEKGQPVVDSLL